MPSTKERDDITKVLPPKEEDDTKYKPNALGFPGLSILRYHEPPAALCETRFPKKFCQLAFGLLEV